MKQKKNTVASATLLAITIIILYTIFALKPLSSELHLTPEWTQDIFHTSIAEDNMEIRPFKLNQNIGYFTPDGKISLSQTFPFKAVVSDTLYATYGSGNSSIQIMDSTGKLHCTIEEYGFPYIQEDRIFMMLPGGNSFARIADDGSQMWQFESYAPITAFSSSQGGTAAGFADGQLITFDEHGSITQRFVPGGSDTNVILGVDISKDGNRVACINGHNKQRFVVAEKNGEHSKIIFHEYLDTDLTRQTLVKFHEDTVYYNYDGGVGVVDLEKLKSYKIPVKGTVSQIEFSTVENLTFILSRMGNNYTVTIVEPFNHVAGTFEFNAETAFIQLYQDALFIGKDNTISRLTISRR